MREKAEQAKLEWEKKGKQMIGFYEKWYLIEIEDVKTKGDAI